jgi:hypothetical protein
MNDTNNLVSDLLNILQPDATETQPEKEQKPKPTKVEKSAKQVPIKEKKVPKETPKIVADTEGFLTGIEDSVKNTMIAKVVIRKDLYEVFMSIKRAKNIKSVSTLLDHALEDYVKRNAENIKKLIYDSQNNAIF